jgi:hypothetical protein
MRILCAIVETATDLLAIRIADRFHRRGIGAQPIGDDLPRLAVFLHDPLEKLSAAALSRFAVTTTSKTSHGRRRARDNRACR